MTDDNDPFAIPPADEPTTDADPRVPGDAPPLTAADPVIVDDPKEPLGPLPDTATTTETLPAPLVINTTAVVEQVGDKLADAIVPTKPGGADLEDIQDDEAKDVIAVAPPRPHASLVDQLDLKWAELKHFVSTLEGDLDGELGEVLALVRSKL